MMIVRRPFSIKRILYTTFLGADIWFSGQQGVLDLCHVVDLRGKNFLLKYNIIQLLLCLAKIHKHALGCLDVIACH